MFEFLIILHIVSLYVGLCLSLYVMLRSARHKTSQKKKIIYIIWKVLWGPFDPIQK
jgi:site-specific recombinase